MEIKNYISIFLLAFSAHTYSYTITESGIEYKTKNSETVRTNSTYEESPFSYYPYISVNIGKATGELEHKNKLSFPRYLPGFDITNSRESSLHGMSIGGALGYAISYKRFYGAVEGFYTNYSDTDSDFDYSNAQSTRPDPSNPTILSTQNIGVVAQDKLNHSYGVNFKLGYFVTNDFLPYFIVGYSKSNYTSQVKSDNPFINHGHEFSLAKFENDFSGLQYGIGMKYFITPHFSVSADYIQANYSTKKVTEKTSWYTKEFELTPYKYDFQLGFQYNF